MTKTPHTARRVVTFRSPAGGQGCTVSAALASYVAAGEGVDTLLICRNGDGLAALGMATGDGLTVSEREGWSCYSLDSTEEIDAHGVAAIAASVGASLVVTDLGGATPAADALTVEGFDVLPVTVVRAHYLPLRAVARDHVDALLIVTTPETPSALTIADVRNVARCATGAEIAHTAAGARAIDAGLAVSAPALADVRDTLKRLTLVTMPTHHAPRATSKSKAAAK